MNGFIERGPELYARVLRDELQQRQALLEDRLNAANSDEEKLRVRAELDRLLADHTTKLGSIRHSLF